jgi:hypothetical protein
MVNSDRSSDIASAAKYQLAARMRNGLLMKTKIDNVLHTNPNGIISAKL